MRNNDGPVICEEPENILFIIIYILFEEEMSNP